MNDTTKTHFRKAFDSPYLSSALAQNAQGEAVGSEPCATVADAVRIADKCRSPDDEGVVWVPESCYLTMVGEIERLETLLYTDGNANIPLHAERARVPAESWTGEIECCDAKGFWLVLADNCPFVPGQRVTIAAAPSQPESKHLMPALKPWPTFRHVITALLLIDAGICGLVWAALKFTN